MIPGTWLHVSNLPLKINGAEVWFDLDGELRDSKGFTNTTFTIMVCHAQCLRRLLNFPTLSGPAVSDWHER